MKFCFANFFFVTLSLLVSQFWVKNFIHFIQSKKSYSLSKLDEKWNFSPSNFPLQIFLRSTDVYKKPHRFTKYWNFLRLKGDLTHNYMTFNKTCTYFITLENILDASKSTWVWIGNGLFFLENYLQNIQLNSIIP